MGKMRQNINDEVVLDEGWIFSYADLMTLILIFFILLYAMAESDTEKAQQIKNALVKSFSDKETNGNELIPDTKTRKLRALFLLLSIINPQDNIQESIQKIELSYNNEKIKYVVDEILKKVDKNFIHNKINSKTYPSYEFLFAEKQWLKKDSLRLKESALAELKSIVLSIQSIPYLVEVSVIGHAYNTGSFVSPIMKNLFTYSAAIAGVVAQKMLDFGLDKQRLHIEGMGNLVPIMRDRKKLLSYQSNRVHIKITLLGGKKNSFYFQKKQNSVRIPGE